MQPNWLKDDVSWRHIKPKHNAKQNSGTDAFIDDEDCNPLLVLLLSVDHPMVAFTFSCFGAK
jgi:hypothetical protein